MADGPLIRRRRRRVSELLQLSPDENPQIWIIGTREQVTHLMNEMTVRWLGGAKQFPFGVNESTSARLSPLRLGMGSNDGAGAVAGVKRPPGVLKTSEV